MNKKIYKILVLIVIALSLSSCYNYRNIGLLQENNPRLPEYPDVAFVEYRLQVNDEIFFRLITSDQTYASLISGGQTNNAAHNQMLSYRIFRDGTIDLPFLKAIPIAGLTLSEAARVLEERFKEIIPDASVKLTLANRIFTVIGQAGTGIYNMPKDRLTLLQALSMSGELAIDADFSKVRIIRENTSGIRIMEFDVRTASIIGSEFYYIYPNDIIYVQKSASSFYKVPSYNSFIGLISTSISLMLTVLYFFK